MSPPPGEGVTFLVFGDLHGKVLPAFRLAAAWARETGTRVAGILQAGDLGYFPDPTRLDPATARFARDDPMELGVQLVAGPSPEADAVFLDPEPWLPECLWFCPGNHEDFDALSELEQMVEGGAPAGSGGGSFAVDAYGRVRCIRNGCVETLPGGLRVGALWGIDSEAPNARRSTPLAARIERRLALELAGSAFDVLLTHESPRDAVLEGSGSEAITAVVRASRPAFAFFGHYEGRGGPVEGEFGSTQVFHLGGFKMLRRGRAPDAGSVGALGWREGSGEFKYLDAAWLRASPEATSS